jgi:hypothetical protein
MSIVGAACGRDGVRVDSPEFATFTTCPIGVETIAIGIYSEECVQSIVGEDVRLLDPGDRYTALYEINTPKDFVDLHVAYGETEDRPNVGTESASVLLQVNEYGVPPNPIEERTVVEGLQIQLGTFGEYRTAYWEDGRFKYSLYVPSARSRSDLLDLIENVIGGPGS